MERGDFSEITSERGLGGAEIHKRDVLREIYLGSPILYNSSGQDERPPSLPRLFTPLPPPYPSNDPNPIPDFEMLPGAVHAPRNANRP